jgi:SNF2 family DNA or RNA helicase
LQQISSGFVPAERTDKIDDELTQSLLLDDDEDSQTVLKDMLHDRVEISDDEARIAVQLARVQKVLSPEEQVAIRATRRVVIDLMPTSENPRLQLLLELLSQYHRKVIVWCRFRRDVEQICSALEGQCVRYDGSVKSSERVDVLRRFRDPQDMGARVLVANEHAISQGVTLVIAKLVIYYSNSFSLEKRLQTEDRAHRIGQDESVQIIDIVATNSIDEHVVETLREKFDLSAAVLGDKVREWIGTSKTKAAMENQ